MNFDKSCLPADTFLGLFEEPFFAFCKEETTITIYNAKKSKLSEGTFPLKEFILHLRRTLPERDIPSLQSFEKHLLEGTDNFSVMFTENFVSELSDVASILIQGKNKTLENGKEITIGIFRLRRFRNAKPDLDIAIDELTGVITKANITSIAIDFIDRDHNEGTYIAIIDVDYFKFINDNYGHQYGDYVLSKVAEIIRAEVGYQGFVGRIGGDEFFVVFSERLDIPKLRDHLQNIRLAVNSTFEGKGPRPNSPLSVSIGAAKYPDDADNFNDLFVVADFCLYLAKEKGRNRYIFYTPEKHPSFAEIKARKEGGQGLINGREDLPLGDVLAQMQYMLKYEADVDLKRIFGEFLTRFRLPYLIFKEEETGKTLFERSASGKLPEYDHDKFFGLIEEYAAKEKPDIFGIYICNDVSHLAVEFSDIIEGLKKFDLVSFILIPITDAGGKKYSLFTASFGTNTVWNEDHFMYFRLFADALSTRSI